MTYSSMRARLRRATRRRVTHDRDRKPENYHKVFSQANVPPSKGRNRARRDYRFFRRECRVRKIAPLFGARCSVIGERLGAFIAKILSREMRAEKIRLGGRNTARTVEGREGQDLYSHFAPEACNINYSLNILRNILHT